MKQLLVAGLLTVIAAWPLHAAARDMAGHYVVRETGVQLDIFANGGFRYRGIAKGSDFDGKWSLQGSKLILEPNRKDYPNIQLVVEGDVLRFPQDRKNRVFRKQGVAQPDATSSGKKQGNEGVPDAMQYIAKGPDIDVESMRDPFVSHLSQIAERRRQQRLAREAKLGRRKHEKLEDFDLSELKLVAIMRMGKDRVAMVQDNSGKGYLVRRNNHMGKNGGRVEKITDNSIVLIESVTNPAGDLVEREVRLTLKEVNEQNAP